MGKSLQCACKTKDLNGNYYSDGMSYQNGETRLYQPNINSTLETKSLVDSITDVQIELVSIDIEKKTFKLRFTYYDIYGLDSADLSKHLTVKMQKGFKAWYVLQHYDAWKGNNIPFITKMKRDFEYSIE